MPRHAGPTDRTNRVVITPAVTRVYWSRQRAWRGDDVELFIETRHVPDGTKVRVEIWENHGGATACVMAIDAGDTIKNGRCRIRHKLDWDEAQLGKPLELGGNEMEFYFRVFVERFGLAERSTLLYVDLHDLHLSC